MRAGPVRSCSATSTSPFSSVPSTATGTPDARWPWTQASTPAGAASRTTGTANSDPVLARTALGSYGSAPCPVTITPAAPNASAERTTVPTFPGLDGRSSTTPRKLAVTRIRA